MKSSAIVITYREQVEARRVELAADTPKPIQRLAEAPLTQGGARLLVFRRHRCRRLPANRAAGDPRLEEPVYQLDVTDSCLQRTRDDIDDVVAR